MSAPLEWLREKFEAASVFYNIQADAVRYALENISLVSQCSEAQCVEQLGEFGLVYAVWFDDSGARFRIIRGPQQIEWPCKMKMSAIPVRDEAEARRWSALLSTRNKIDGAPTVQLATDHGERRI